MKKIVSVAFIALLLVGCILEDDDGGNSGGGNITRAQWEQISVPMDFGDLIDIMGRGPDKTTNQNRCGAKSFEWNSGNDSLGGIAVDNRVYLATISIIPDNLSDPNEDVLGDVKGIQHWHPEYRKFVEATSLCN
jgi:hypothetical protein